MRNIKKITALMLAVSMIFTSSGLSVLAADETGKEGQTQVSEEISETENTAETGNVAAEAEVQGEAQAEVTEVQEEAQVEVTEVQEKAQPEVTEKQKAFEYIYVDEQSVNIPEEQNIVVAFADTELQIESATMHYSVVESGTAYDVPASNIVDNTVLFTQQYTDVSQIGQYRGDSITYRIAGQTEDVTVNFAEQEVTAEYTVTTEAETDVQEAAADTAASEVSVYSLDDAGNAIEQSSDTENIESTVESVLETVDESSTEAVSSKARTARQGGKQVIVICAGHDATHTGASGNGLKEEQLTWKVAQYCKAELEKYAGVTVYLDRDSINCAYPGQSTSYCLNQRVKDAKAKGADIFVDIHFNAVNGVSTNANGSEVYYPNNSYSSAIHQDGEELANSILAQLTALGLYNRGAKIKDATTGDKDANGNPDDYFTSINLSKSLGMTGIIVEHAFLDNAGDAAKLKNEDFIKQLGVADAKGIAAHYKLGQGTWKQNSKGWWYEYSNGSWPSNSWELIEGDWYHFDKDGYRQTGFIDVGSERFYLNNEGKRLTTWQLIDNKWYYFYEYGPMAKGWLLLGNTWYYLDTSGVMVTGWKKIGGSTYYFRTDGSMVTGTQTIDGEKYQFDSSGACQTGKSGWVQEGNKWYYYKNDKKATGWLQLGNTWYYLNSSGVMQTGWLKLGSTWYYLHSSGEMATGWLLLGNTWYYLVDSGAMVTGWLLLGNTWYYMNGAGAMVTGWLLLGNTWYYLYGSGAMAVGWAQVGSTWYYMNGSGAMCTGWALVGSTWYYLNSSGAMQTGWLKLGNTWYYLESSGAMVTGWKDIGGSTYYFRTDGSMVTGTQTIDGVKYQFNSSGACQDRRDGWRWEGSAWYYYSNNEKVTGWAWIENAWYYLEESGAMRTGWLKLGNTWYYLEGSGVMVTGWKDIGNYTYYFRSDGSMVTGSETIDGVKYQFDNSGVCQNAKSGWKLENSAWYYYDNGKKVIGWVKDGETWYYTDNSGAMMRGYQQINGTWYYFNENRSPDGALTYTGVTTIMGNSDIGSDKAKVVEKFVKMYQKRGVAYPQEALKKGGADTINRFCEIVYEEAVAEGVKPEVVFAQAMKETGYLKFGGDVKIEQFNFAGLGATGGGVQGNSFADVRTGIRAQVQHLKAYASNQSLNNACVDTRFNYVKRNSAPYVEWLGIKENPEGKGWAMAQGYGFSLMNDYIKPIQSL